MPIRHLAYDDVRDGQDPAQLELLHFDPAVRRIAALAAASFQMLAMGRWVNREQCNHYPALDSGHSSEARRVLTACPLWKAAVGRNEIPGTVLEIVRTENDVPYFALQCGRVDLAAPLPQNPVPVLSICPARIHSLTVIVEEPYHGEELREAATGQQRIRPASRVAQNLAGAAVEQQPRMHPDADVERMDHQCRVC